MAKARRSVGPLLLREAVVEGEKHFLEAVVILEKLLNHYRLTKAAAEKEEEKKAVALSSLGDLV